MKAMHCVIMRLVRRCLCTECFREEQIMSFKKRLIFIFLLVILLPLCLTFMALLVIGTFLNSQNAPLGSGFNFNWAVQSYGQITEEIAADIDEVIDVDSAILENNDYLSELNEAIADKNSYIVVRKNDVLYYAGDEEAAERIFNRLPEFGTDREDREAGYYYDDMQKFVRQFDFHFSDGSEGSVFIVSRVSSLINKNFLWDMLIALIFIMIFTALMLTRWINNNMLAPINTLNKAMQNIADGNFDYRISTPQKGEIGELYKNYDDMRLRLKETTEERLRQEEKSKELISNISHDLKTPITAIKGYVEGIMDGVADTPEKVDKYIKTIYNKANDMDRLINELTTYTKLDANKIPYNFQRINLADYFEDCREEIGLELEDRKIVFNYSNLVAQDTVIIADPEQLKKVINNIIGNSIKYLDRPDGEIDIRILDEVDSIRVEIEDNGKGISARDLPYVFERFYRTDASRNSSKGGSGIGLSIVKKIIEDHGGYIWATSKEGEGTCMHFVLRKYIVNSKV